MIHDEMREKFESQCIFDKQRVQGDYAMPDGRSLKVGDYLYMETQIAWQAYQAGWQALLSALGGPVCRVDADGAAITTLPESTPLYALLKEQK